MGAPPSYEAANFATFGTLIFFFIATLAISQLDMCKKKFDADQYMSARNTQGVFSLTMSFFASGAGAWVLFTVPEAAVLGGPIAVLGYALSCVFPLLIFAFVGPTLREMLPYGITFFEFVQARYGTAVNMYVTLIATFYMFLYLAAEFTSVGSCFTLFSSPPEDGSNAAIAPIVGTSIVTIIYTTLGGLPVSLITDRVQGLGVLILTLLLIIAAFGFVLYPTFPDIYVANNASLNWRTVTTYGVGSPCGGADFGNALSMAVVLILAVTSANVMHTGYQQRIWAARDNAAIYYGLIGAAVVTLPFVLIFGLFGMIAYANFGPGLILGPPYLGFLSAFFLVGTMPTGWQLIAVILAVMMVASSADTIQTGMAGLFSPAIDRLLCRSPGDGKVKLALGVNFVITILINILAIVLATQGISVLSLFVLADLLCATCVVPVIMGLSDKCHPLAALCGCLGGLATAMIIYAVGGWGCNEPGNFELLLAPGGLYAKTALAAFILTPVVSGVLTLVVGLPFYLKGYRFAGFEGAPGATNPDGPTKPDDIVVSSA